MPRLTGALVATSYRRTNPGNFLACPSVPILDVRYVTPIPVLESKGLAASAAPGLGRPSCLQCPLRRPADRAISGSCGVGAHLQAAIGITLAITRAAPGRLRRRGSGPKMLKQSSDLH
jgi:hypothetical protein